jgi:ABC-type lipopolysaccharide export system ATPase subunit
MSIDVKFVLLDEPFNGISPINIEAVKNMIRKNAQHRGIILTDHDYRNVIDVANRHYLMYDGGIKIVRDREDLAFRGYMSEARAGKLMFYKSLKIPFPKKISPLFKTFHYFCVF